jgi:hypothetical protein
VKTKRPIKNMENKESLLYKLQKSVSNYTETRLKIINDLKPDIINVVEDRLFGKANMGLHGDVFDVDALFVDPDRSKVHCITSMDNEGRLLTQLGQKLHSLFRENNVHRLGVESGQIATRSSILRHNEFNNVCDMIVHHLKQQGLSVKCDPVITVTWKLSEK